MQEIIKSKDVRKYLQEKNFCFTDFEKATLIYNSDWSIPEKHQALSELLEGTEDELLRVQIQERITWDNTCITKIKSMPGNVIHSIDSRYGRRQMESINQQGILLLMNPQKGTLLIVSENVKYKYLNLNK